MVDRIKSSLAREAILAALKDQTDAARNIKSEANELFQSALESSASGKSPAASASSESTQSTSMIDGIKSVDEMVRGAEPDRMAQDMLSGEVRGFHEVAARINSARITFEFAMEVRNKLIDAYRETMRMTV